MKAKDGVMVMNCRTFCFFSARGWSSLASSASRGFSGTGGAARRPLCLPPGVGEGRSHQGWRSLVPVPARAHGESGSECCLFSASGQWASSPAGETAWNRFSAGRLGGPSRSWLLKSRQAAMLATTAVHPRWQSWWGLQPHGTCTERRRLAA